MTDFRDDKGIPGGWGEYFAAINGLSVMMQSGKFQNFEEVLAAINVLNTSNDSKYNALAAIINTHISNQNNLDHKLNSLDVGKGLVDNIGTAAASQTGTDFDNLFTTPANAAAYIAMNVGLTVGEDIHKQNINPISTYGDKTWLPVNVTQTYAGATAITAHAPEVSMMEDNSTYMGIHAGTNGVTRGLYYHSLVDAVRRDDKVAVMNMHHKYTPKGLTSGDATSLISTDGQCIVGRISNGSATGFISITKGDLNPANHKTVFITLPFTEVFDVFSTACVAGDYVYLFRGPVTTSGNTNKALATAYEFAVYRVQISTMVEGGAVTATQVNGWATTGLHGLYNGNTVRLANCMTSSAVADRPLMLHSNSAWLGMLDPLNCNMRVHAEVNPDNSNQIRLAIYHTAKATTINGESAYGFMAYSLLLTLGTSPVAAIEDGGTYVTVGSGSVNSIALSSGSMLNPRNVTGVDRHVGWSNTCISRAGYVLTRYNDLIKNNNCIFAKSKIIGFTSKFNALRYKTLSLDTVVTAPIVVDSETDFTTNMTNPRSMPGNYVMMNGQGRSYVNQGNYSRGKRVSVPGTPTVTYPTVNSGNLLGWTNSLGVSDYSANRTFNQCIFISRCNARDTIMTCDASVMYRGGDGGGLVIDQNGIITGIFTYTASEAEKVVFDSLKLITNRTDIFQYDWVIYASQDTNIPLTVVAGYTVPNGDGYRGGHVMFELNHTGSRTGLVTGYTYKKLCKHETYSNTGKGVWLDVETMGGYQHYSTDVNDRLVSIGCPVVIQGLSNDPGIIGLRRDVGVIFFAAIRGTALGTYENSTIKVFVHDNYPGGVTPSGVVNSTIGLGIVNYATNNANYNTLMSVNSMALNYTQFVAWNVLNEYVMTSQKKVTNSTFKFYCDEPVFMAGREYTITKKTVSLTSITPAPNGNTFYVGVSIVDNTADYDISLTARDPAISYMPIGTIVVDDNGISTITLRKPIRVDIYEMQTYRRGTGIPRTIGSALSEGKFHWLSDVFKDVSFTYYDTQGVAHNSYNANYDIAYVLMNYNLNTTRENVLRNVTVTIEEHTGVDEDYFMFKLPGNYWETKTSTVVTSSIPVNGSLRIDVAVNDDYAVDKRITTALKVTISFGEVRYITNTDTLGYTLAKKIDGLTKHIASGNLQPNATARIKFGGGGNGFAWPLAPVQHGGTGFPSGSSPNGISITMPRPYDNPRNVTVITPLNSDPANPAQYVFQRIGSDSVDNVTGCVLNVDLGHNVHAKVITPNPVNGLPWFNNAGPVVELTNFGSAVEPFRLLVGNQIGKSPVAVTRALKEWAVEHMPPWYYDDEKIFTFQMNIDDSGYFDIDFKTGLVTIAVNNDRRSYTGNVTYHLDGSVWTPNIVGGGWEDYGNYVTAEKTYPEMNLLNVAAIPNLSIRTVKTIGRNSLYVMDQPSAANNYVARVVIRDPSGGAAYYQGDIYLTSTNKEYTGTLRDVGVELGSVTAGPVVIHPIDSVWNLIVTNDSAENITNMSIDIMLAPATSGDSNNLTFSTVKAPAGSDTVYQVVTTKTVTVSVVAGGVTTIQVPVYGNSVPVNGVEQYSNYNVNVNMLTTMNYAGEQRITATADHNVLYLNRASEVSISMLDLTQVNPARADTVWEFQIENMSGSPMLGAVITYERIVDPVSTVNNGITFNNTANSGGTAVGDRYYAVEIVKSFTADIGMTPFSQSFTLYGNYRLANVEDVVTPVEDKYNVWVGMRVTVAYAGDTHELLFPNQYRVITDGSA